VRIAHFSDLHLLATDGVRLLDLVNKRWIGALNLLANRGRHHQPEIFEAMIEDINQQDLDHLICTGDITNLALEQEFRYAQELFARFKLGADQISVIPGNHDAYVQKGIELFQGYFDSYHRSDEEFAWPDGDPWPLVRVREHVAIVGLSTSFQTPWFTAYGEVGHKQRERLRAILSDERVAGKFRIVFVHHPVVGRRAENRIRGLKDWERFGAVIRECGAELILHGHEHRDYTSHVDGPTGQIEARCIQSGSYEADRPNRRARYRIYNISQVGDIPQIVGEDLRVWDPTTLAFKPEQSLDFSRRQPGSTPVAAVAP